MTAIFLNKRCSTSLGMGARRVKFDLVDRRDNGCIFQEFLEVVFVPV